MLNYLGNNYFGNFSCQATLIAFWFHKYVMNFWHANNKVVNQFRNFPFCQTLCLLVSIFSSYNAENVVVMFHIMMKENSRNEWVLKYMSTLLKILGYGKSVMKKNCTSLQFKKCRSINYCILVLYYL